MNRSVTPEVAICPVAGCTRVATKVAKISLAGAPAKPVLACALHALEATDYIVIKVKVLCGAECVNAQPLTVDRCKVLNDLFAFHGLPPHNGGFSVGDGHFAAACEKEHGTSLAELGRVFKIDKAIRAWRKTQIRFAQTWLCRTK